MCGMEVVGISHHPCRPIVDGILISGVFFWGVDSPLLFPPVLSTRFLARHAPIIPAPGK